MVEQVSIDCDVRMKRRPCVWVNYATVGEAFDDDAARATRSAAPARRRPPVKREPLLALSVRRCRLTPPSG